MSDVTERSTCRVCAGALATVLDLGGQCLAGQFPAIGEPAPLRAPLGLCRCDRCGLLQLRHTVGRDLMFRAYGYRSGVTATMRDHLKGLAREAVGEFVGRPGSILDVGGNDGTLLEYLEDDCDGRLTCVDPSDVECAHAHVARVRDFFPCAVPGGPFDLVFAVACLYDAGDPTNFAAAVRDALAPDGLWCVEVADADATLACAAPAWDQVVHEHLCYYSLATLDRVACRAGLRLVKASRNECNGGSVRAYFCRVESGAYAWYGPVKAPRPLPGDFAARVGHNAEAVRESVLGVIRRGGVVHALGASTKGNTLLQYCRLGTGVIECASERDPRKVGRRTPGTDIPIVSEEASRGQCPGAYLVLPWHFRDEVVAREADYLAGVGRLIFPLPRVEVVAAEGAPC